MQKKYSVSIIVLVLSIMTFSCLSYVFYPESIDDAYITLRFAKNVDQGYGPVFNQGEKVEGFSNFTWMMMLALVGKSGIPMEKAMKIISFICGIITMFLIWKLTKTITEDKLIRSMAVCVFGFSSFIAVWSVDGLETMFYIMLLTILLYLMAQKMRNYWLIGLTSGIISISRPEGILFFAVAIAYLLYKKEYRGALYASSFVGVIFGGYLCFRFFYYQQLLPNTALVKLHPNTNSIKNGWAYLLNFNKDSGYLIFPLAIVGLYGIRFNRFLVVPTGFIIAQIVFILLSGGDFMYAYRFIIPILPSMILLITTSFIMMLTKSPKSFVCILFSGIIIIMALMQFSSLPQKVIRSDNLSWRFSPLFDIAYYLNDQNLQPRDTILLSEAGIIPYFTDVRTVDYLGLTSAHDLIYSGDGTLRLNYIFSYKPRFIILSSTLDQNGNSQGRLEEDRMIMSYSEFLKDYKLVKVFPIPRMGSFLNQIYYKYTPQAKLISFDIYKQA